MIQWQSCNKSFCPCLAEHLSIIWHGVSKAIFENLFEKYSTRTWTKGVPCYHLGYSKLSPLPVRQALQSREWPSCLVSFSWRRTNQNALHNGVRGFKNSTFRVALTACLKPPSTCCLLPGDNHNDHSFLGPRSADFPNSSKPPGTKTPCGLRRCIQGKIGIVFLARECSPEQELITPSKLPVHCILSIAWRGSWNFVRWHDRWAPWFFWHAADDKTTVLLVSLCRRHSLWHKGMLRLSATRITPNLATRTSTADWNTSPTGTELSGPFLGSTSRNKWIVAANDYLTLCQNKRPSAKAVPPR